MSSAWISFSFFSGFLGLYAPKGSPTSLVSPFSSCRRYNLSEKAVC